MMRVERIAELPQLEALLPEWRALERRACVRLPFLTAAWARTWWEHFAEKRWGVIDRLEVRAVRGDDDLLVGVAPLMLTERPSVGPIRVRVLQFFGSDPNVTELRGPLYDPAFEREASTALVRNLLASAADYDWLRWSGLRAGSEAEAAVSEIAQVRWEANSSDYVLALPQTWDQLRKRLPRNVKESLRKCYNSLKREGHQARLEVAKDAAAVHDALDHFLRLHRSRAALASNVRHLDVFGSGRARSFLRALCADMVLRGEARVYLLHVGKEVVAARVAFLHGRHLYLYYSGYEVSWGRFGVSTTLVAEAIRHAIDEGLEAVNFSFGSDVSKLRWRPTEVQYQAGVQPSREARAMLMLTGFKLARRSTTVFGKWRHRSAIVRAIAERLPLARSFESDKER